MPHARRTAPVLTGALTGALIAALAVGCSDDTAAPVVIGQGTSTPYDDAVALSTSAPGASVETDPLLAFFAFARLQDAALLETAALPRGPLVRAVVRGTVVGYRPGLHPWHPVGRYREASMEMVVAVERTLRSATDLGDRVRVALPARRSHTPDDFAAVLPTGTEVVVYLAEPEDHPDAFDLGLTVPSAPQGLAVATSGGTVFPLDSARVSPRPLDDQLPED